jgi:hypothetical protein
MSIQTGRSKHEAEEHDSETIKFLVDVPGHVKGEVCTLLRSYAHIYLGADPPQAELVPAGTPHKVPEVDQNEFLKRLQEAAREKGARPE